MARPTRTSVFLVGVSPPVRSAVRQALAADDVEVIGEVGTGDAALPLARTRTLGSVDKSGLSRLCAVR